MILRKEILPVPREKVILVKDCYDRTYYISHQKFLEKNNVLIPIYRKFKGEFFRDKNELCLHRLNIKETIGA